MAKKQEALEFKWEGTNKTGRKVSGVGRAATDVSLRISLRKQGITILKMKKVPKPLFKGAPKKIEASDISIFTRQLATMMTAGIPVVKAIDIIALGTEHPSLRKLLFKVKTDVESGLTLTQAIAKHPNEFDDLFCSLVDAGEKSGTLETLLDRIAIYKEKTESLKKKIKKAMTYPISVMVIAFVVTVILLLKVVPTFDELFKSFGAELPAFTQMVINLSHFVQEWWLIGAAGAAGTIYGVKSYYRKTKKFRNFVDIQLLKAPIIGEIFTKASIARFSRTLSTMSAAGMPLVEALGSVATATGNYVYTEATYGIRDEVESGTPLNVAMEQSDVFPNMVLQMVSIGEESGAIDEMLSKVADYYEEEVDNAVDSISSLIEPIIMSFLGVVVGGLVLSMYLPIFKLGSVI